MASVSRRNLLRAGVFGGLAAAGAAAATGCSGPFVNTGAKKRLQFWAFTDTRIAWQKRAFELYKKARKPDFEIDWLILPYTQMHDQLLITAEAGSGGPDIADVEISQFPRFIKGDPLFVDLRPHVEAAHEWDNFYHASATDPWSWHGKAYGLGSELNACLLSYRADLWKQAGIDTEVTSWEEFVEQGKKFHHATGHYLIDNDYTGWSTWWQLTLQQGGGFFDADGHPTLDAPEGVGSLTWMQNSVREGWSTLRPAGNAYYVALASGAIASQIAPSWQFSGFTQQNIPQTKGKWRVRPFPLWKPGGSPTATNGGTGVCVSKHSESVDEAIDFVIFEHTSREALLYDFDHRQVWPTYSPTFESPKLTQPLAFFGGQRVGKVINEVSGKINKLRTSPFWSEVTDACTRLALTPAMQTMSLSPRSALAAAQRSSERVIDFETA